VSHTPYPTRGVGGALGETLLAMTPAGEVSVRAHDSEDMDFSE
jgi:hypothetical protein